MGPFVLSLLASTAIPATSLAQQPSGTTVGVTPAASASGVTGSRVLEVQGGIYTGDQVTTDAGGEAQIRFVDDTRFVVGPNSRVVIDEFVFNPNNTAQEVGISAVKGTFRFISGVSPSDAYSIRTPTMSIGIRGTGFDLAVRGGGESTLAWLSGSGEVCDAAGQCVTITEGCTVIVAPPGGGFADLQPGEQAQRLNTFFPYLRSQGGLPPDFRLDTSACDLGSPAPFVLPAETAAQKQGAAPSPPPPPPPPPEAEPEAVPEPYNS